VKLVSSNKKIDNMSEEDFNYFYGILNKKIHKSTKHMMLKEKAA